MLVGNVGRLQGGVRLLPKAEPDNGLMEVAILRPRHLGRWVMLAAAVLLRRPESWDDHPAGQPAQHSRRPAAARQLDGDVITPADHLT